MSDWKEIEGKLFKSLVFKDFKSAFSFMQAVADVAEAANHHPTWKNTYNCVDIYLSTHDAGDIVTEQDRSLARKIDQILADRDFQVAP